MAGQYNEPKKILNNIISILGLNTIDNNTIDNALMYIYKLVPSNISKDGMNRTARITYTTFNVLINSFKKRYENYDTLKFTLNLGLGMKYASLFAASVETSLFANVDGSTNNGWFYLENTNKPNVFFKWLAQTIPLIIANGWATSFSNWLEKQYKNQIAMESVIKFFNTSIKDGFGINVIDILFGVLGSMYLNEVGDKSNLIDISGIEFIKYFKDLDKLQINTTVVTGADEINRLKQEIIALNAKIKELEAKLKEEQNKHLATKQGWDSDKIAWKTERERLSKDNSDLETSRNKAQEELTKKEARVKTLEDSIKDFNAKIAEKQKMIDDLNNKIASLENVKTQDINKLIQQNSQLQTTIDQLNTEVSLLKKSIGDLSKVRSTLEAEKIKTQEEIAKLLELVYNTLQPLKNDLSTVVSNINSVSNFIINKANPKDGYMERLKDQYVKLLENSIGYEDNLIVPIRELEKIIADNPLTNIRENVKNSIFSAIQNSNAMRQFTNKMTDKINQLFLMNKKTMLGSVDQQNTIITGKIKDLVKDMSEMVKTLIDFKPEDISNSLEDLRNTLNNKNEEYSKHRIETNKAISRVTEKVQQIKNMYPTPDEIQSMVNNSINKLVYYFTKKALLAFDEIKSQMYQRYA